MNHLVSGFDSNPDQDLVVGDVTVSPSLNRIALGDCQRRVEPRIMQVLVLLARHQGQSISRDTLLHHCWGGVFVAEDSLNRSIFQLRRALRDVGSTRLRVETIPKFGYALFVDDGAPQQPTDTPNAVVAEIASASMAPAASADRPVAVVRTSTPRWPLISAVAVLLLAVCVLGFTYWRSEGAGKLADVHRFDVLPLTLEPGLELFPALSPDGQTAAYAARNALDDFDIILRGTGPNGRMVSLTNTEDHDRVPVWSPNGDAIAFLRSDHDWHCAIYVIAVPAGTEHRVGNCLGDELPNLAWRPDGKAIIITGVPDSSVKISKLMVMPLDGTPPSVLPVPSASNVEDWLPAYSPDGSKLSFLRAWPGGALAILVVDVASGMELGRLPVESGYVNYVWSTDGQGFYLTNASRQHMGLWYADLKSGQWQPVMPGVNRLGRLAIANVRGNIAMEIYRGYADIVEFTASGQQRTLQGSSADEMEPQLSPDGRAMAFVSDRTGEPQVWLVEEDRPARPLTSMTGANMSGLRWSPDGRALLFVAEVGLASDLYRVNIADDATTRLTHDGHIKNPPAWLPDGTIRIPIRGDLSWDIWAIYTDGKEPVKVDEKHDYVAVSADGSMLLTGNNGDKQLTWTSLKGEGAGVLELPFILRRGNVAICPDTIYAARMNLPSAEVIAVDRKTGVERSLGKVARTEAGGPISADCSNGSVIMMQFVGQESDLVLLNPAKH